MPEVSIGTAILVVGLSFIGLMAVVSAFVGAMIYRLEKKDQERADREEERDRLSLGDGRPKRSFKL